MLQSDQAKYYAQIAEPELNCFFRYRSKYDQFSSRQSVNPSFCVFNTHVIRDFLIVGQGLAGSLLAWELLQHNQTVLLVDDRYSHAASRVAAGIVNPLAGRRMVKSKDLDDCWSSALTTYAELDRQFQQQFFVPKPLIRLFNDSADIDRYRQRTQQAEYQQLLGDCFSAGHSGQPVIDPNGGFVQLQAGYLNVSVLLEALQSYFIRQKLLIDTVFDYADVQIGKNSIRWQSQVFKHIIFCEGARTVDNPWFRWLPFQLSKGELLSFRPGSVVPSTAVAHHGHWVLPINEQLMKIGATYTWQWNNDQPSSEAEQQLLAFAKRLLGEDVPMHVIDHRAGIRPTTRDKQPFIGSHPEYTTLHIFNGFGSRGSLIIPHYAKLFIRSLLNPDDNCLPGYVDIARFEHGDSQVTLSKRLLSQRIQEGDIAVDATLGKGFDTEFLARCVGQSGHVFSFDIQPQALQISRERLANHQVIDRVSLIKADHASLLAHVPKSCYGRVRAVTFNLGYLPGHSKNIVTQASTTVLALQQALQLLMQGGMISVVCYRGHPEGSRELEAIHVWIDGLDKRYYRVQWFGQADRASTPLLLVITRRIKLS